MKPFNPAGVRSMTGQGHASDQSDLGTITVEVRTVNNRGFKCSSRISDSLSALDNKIETLARSLIHRGSVTLSISWRKPDNQDAPAVNREILKSYAQHLQQVRQELDDPSMTIELASLMTLPGVFVTHREDRRKDDELWAFVRGAIKAANKQIYFLTV